MFSLDFSTVLIFNITFTMLKIDNMENSGKWNFEKSLEFWILLLQLFVKYNFNVIRR